MKRHLAPLAFIAGAAIADPTQQPWNGAGPETARPAPGAPAKAEAIFPLSPNVILGRARYGDARNHIAVLLLDRAPGGRDLELVARDADCTPRAILVPMSGGIGSRTVVCFVSHGEVTPGMEIVLPGKALLERSLKTLSAHPVDHRQAPAAPAPEAKTGR